MTTENQTFWPWHHSSGIHNVHYLEKGSGSRHILLIHGFGGHSFTWRFLIDQLAKAGYHVWSFDLIGFGYSDKPSDVRYGKDLFVSQIQAFMEAKKIESATLVGNSMGGGLALTMAIEHPEKIQALVLIDPFAFPLKLPFYFAAPKRFGKLTKPFFGRTMTKMLLKEIMYDPRKITEEQITAYTFPFQLSGGKEAFIKTLQNFDPADFDRLSLHYKDLKIPILFIWGKGDRLMPEAYQKKFPQMFPKSETLKIPFCGHIPQEECPEQVIQAILEFLRFR